MPAHKHLLSILLNRLSLYLQVPLAILLPLGLFYLSWIIVDEVEVLFVLFHVLLLVAIAFAFDLLPAATGAILIDLSVDFHYIKPIGRLFGSMAAYGLAICVLLFFVMMRMLRNSILAEHMAKTASDGAVKVRENILAMVSHDLRQPISAAKLGVEMNERFFETGNVDQMKKSNLVVRSSLERID